MISNPGFEWEQSILMKKDIFSEHFDQANKLSGTMVLPVSVMNSNKQVGMFYSTQAYNNLLKQINSLKQEILTLKNKQKENIMRKYFFSKGV